MSRGVIGKNRGVPLGTLPLLPKLKWNNLLTTLEPIEVDINMITPFYRHMRLNVLIFWGFSASYCSCFVQFFYETFLPVLTAKISPGINNCEYFIKGWGHFINRWFIWDIKYFDSTLAEYKILYPKIHRKTQGLRLATLLKKWFWHKCFSVNFAKFLRTPFFKEHLRWLLLEHPIILQKISLMVFRSFFSKKTFKGNMILIFLFWASQPHCSYKACSCI